MKKLLSLFALTTIFVSIALADIVPPPTPKPAPKGKQVEMFIDVTNDVTETTLVIKKSSTKLLRAALDEAEGLENSSAQNQTITPSSSASTQLVIGGMFLTLAFVFGGVWLARSKPSKTIVGLFLVGILASATVLVVANIAPPMRFGIDKNMFAPEFKSGRGGTARGKVQVKIVNDSNSASPDIKLLIPLNPEKMTNEEE